MRLKVRHTTRYRYDAPVAHALQRLRLTPKRTQGQEILAWDMTFENARPELSYEDQHRNAVTMISVEPGATMVSVTCDGLVDTHDHHGVIGHHAGHLPLWSFIGQTPLTRPGPALQALAEAAGDGRTGGGEARLAMLHGLSAMVLDTVAYRVGETGADTPAEVSLTGGAGVCQDHAHIFIGAARSLGIPARYVSGYLKMDDRVEQDATHAWAEAYVHGLGWVGFDVSNGISPDDRYVRVATGRDYRDAAPVAGISYGNATHVLEVGVAVEQQQQ